MLLYVFLSKPCSISMETIRILQVVLHLGAFHRLKIVSKRWMNNVHISIFGSNHVPCIAITNNYKLTIGLDHTRL